MFYELALKLTRHPAHGSPLKLIGSAVHPPRTLTAAAEVECAFPIAIEDFFLRCRCQVQL